MKYLYNPPTPVKMLFSKFQWNTSNNKVLFTFDDGPVPGNTDKILRKLDESGIKAVFFCVGNNVKNNLSLVSEITKEGHSIGNHTMNHKILSRSGWNEIALEINLFNTLMEEKLNYHTKYFRPPHGRFGISLSRFINQSNLLCVMWSLLTYDYKNNLDEVKKSSKHLRNNSIIVLHDSLKNKDIITDSIDLISDSIYTNNYLTGTPLECLK